VIPLTDSVIDQLGHDVHSCYVENYWLPILGPSAIRAARRLADWLEASPESVEARLESLARSLGLGGGVARNSPIVRTLVRLVDLSMASVGGSVYGIRTTFRPLPARHITRLPSCLARSHELEVAR
jgi:hypothetical protein